MGLSHTHIITKPNIKKNPLSNYHRAPPLYQNWVQGEEIDSDFLKLIERVEVNVVEVQGIWDEEDEILKSVVAMWGDTPQRNV